MNVEFQLNEIRHSRAFEIVDYESKLKIHELKITIQYAEKKCKKQHDLDDVKYRIQIRNQ